MNLSYIINLKSIEPQEWERAFEGIRRIVENYPIELVRMKSENKLGVERFCWTNEVFFEEENTQCIQLKGDGLTLEYGSTFTFYKDIEVQLSKNEDADYSRNPFYLSPEQNYFDCITGYSGFDILNNWDTCGHPYTYCILAIGIYLEHCFYEKSYLAGDYNPAQIEIVLSWLNDVFKTSICEPKTIDHNSLWQKLSPLYSNSKDAIIRFWFLSKQSSSQKIAYLLEQNKDETEQYLVDELKNYTSVHQWGATDILMPYLVACDDLDSFVLFFKKVQKTNTHEAFNLCKLLEMILEKGICEPPFENEMIKEINKSRPSLETGMEGLNRLFFKMGGLPNTTDFYATADELLEVFAYYEPQNGKVFKDILDTNVEKIKEKRKEINSKIEASVDNIIANIEDDFKASSDKIKMFGFRNEDYFVGEAQSQRKTYKNFQEGAKIIGGSIRKNLVLYKEKYKEDYIDLKDKNEILKYIYKAVSKRGFVLTEKAWDNMDNEPDVEVLESIAYYVSVTEREIQFWAWRKYYLENNNYWIYFKSI